MAKEFLLALDAGHGMNTAGKRCLKSIDPNETREWFLNDRVCRYIAERAAMYEGFKTMRVDDPTGKTDVSRQERCRRANEAKADNYHSTHFNAGVNGGSGGGVVAYCMRGGVEAKAVRDGVYKALIAAGALKGNRTSPCLEKNWDVLVWSDMPAVLIEYGFMDSTTDVPVILTEAYAKTVGYATADWYARYKGLSMKNEAEPVAGFTDVPATAWYADSVQWAVSKGITNGVESGKFAPDDICTRAEAVTFLWRSFGKPVPVMAYTPFDDVKPSAWYNDAVCWALEQGITQGTDTHTFSPDAACTRAQVVTMLWRAAGSPEPAGYQPFTDVQPASWYAKAVQWAVDEAITNGADSSHFSPDAPCTRAEMVTFLYRKYMTK